MTYEVKNVVKVTKDMKKEGYKIIAFAGSYGVTLKKGKSVITIIAK